MDQKGLELSSLGRPKVHNDRVAKLFLSRKSFGLAVLTVSVLSTVSLAFGYLREILIAQFYGSGRETDAYFVAYFTPQTIYQLALTGPIVWAFVPLFRRIASQEGQEPVDELVAALQGRILPVLSIVTVSLIVFAPGIVSVISPGFSDDQQELTSYLMRIMLPQLVLYGVGAIYSAMALSFGLVSTPALAQLLNNVVLIFLLVVLQQTLGIDGAAVATSVASAVYVLVLVGSLSRNGHGMKVSFRHRVPYSREMTAAFIPFLLLALINIIPGYWERGVASRLEPGDLSNINYGFRITQLAQVLLGSVGSVALVGLSDSMATKSDTSFTTRSTWSAYTNVVIGILFSGLFLALSHPIVSILYGHGNVSERSIDSISMVTSVASLALPLVGLQVVINQALFASQRRRVVVRFSLFYALLLMPTTYLLMTHLGYIGFPMANVLSMAVVSVVMYQYSVRSGLMPFLSTMVPTVSRSTVAGISSAGLSYWTWMALAPYAELHLSPILRPMLQIVFQGGMLVVIFALILFAMREPIVLQWSMTSRRWLTSRRPVSDAR